ncbi:hypothetical protein J7438_11175 [Thalassotalea sp. G20_0]|uniref:hypothetical protein n=1 Tax=Thalassotalea sp. G20_0 TaxID=2821093 RepID=UPI001ADBF4A5|nr:hypothetical protein [Thalassotalea sp. G20_0]MBO9494648.1 hypothetical protein [Thalassotalea sp. G20_0]
MKTLRTLALATVVSVGVLGSTSAVAVTQGNLGSTSTGIFDITLIKGELARVWGLKDVELVDANSDSNFDTYTSSFCIFANKGLQSNDFDLSITSASSTPFSLKDISGTQGATDIAYTVKITDSASTELVAENADGATKTGRLNAGSLLSQPLPGGVCTGNENMDLEIALVNSSFTSIQTGTYTDKITLLVQPK